MTTPTGIFSAIPSRLGVGETFALDLKILGPVHQVEPNGTAFIWKPQEKGPYNRNVSRGIQYMDNTLPEWQGQIQIDGGDALKAPKKIEFDGQNQGVYNNDSRYRTQDARPIKTVNGLQFTAPGFHFIRLIEPETGLEAWTNPVYVSQNPPEERIWWGDPHWQTFFSDGIRCPEELYSFARDEAFLDFGAISDHMEGVTDRQWNYFQMVTNDYNEPGRFATLHGQEWTNHAQKQGAPGHRNIYYRGDGGPPLRCNDTDCNTLEKLWQKLDASGVEALAIPHHSANHKMGVDWDQGWNDKYEKAVEIYSVWGNSEKPASSGNPLPIPENNNGGEMAGRHVVNALQKGYRMGFVGGGDIHDGRPGDCLHDASYPERGFKFPNQGLTAAFAPALTREGVFDAMANHRTYATTNSRIYLETDVADTGDAPRLTVRAASEEGIEAAVLVHNGEEPARLTPKEDSRIIEDAFDLKDAATDDFCYVRIETKGTNLAWSSPVWL